MYIYIYVYVCVYVCIYIPPLPDVDKLFADLLLRVLHCLFETFTFSSHGPLITPPLVGVGDHNPPLS